MKPVSNTLTIPLGSPLRISRSLFWPPVCAPGLACSWLSLLQPQWPPGCSSKAPAAPAGAGVSAERPSPGVCQAAPWLPPGPFFPNCPLNSTAVCPPPFPLAPSAWFTFLHYCLSLLICCVCSYPGTRQVQDGSCMGAGLCLE